MIFENNYKLASSVFEASLGKIAEGYQADMVVVEYEPPTPMTNENFLAHFFFGMLESWNPSSVFIAGRELVQDGKLITLDVFDIYKRAVEVSKKLWTRFDELL